MSTKKSVKLVALVMALCMVLSLVLVACSDACPPHIDVDGDGICDKCNKEMPKAVKITVTAPDSKIAYNAETKKHETLTVTVTVENTDNKGYTWSYSEPGIVKVQDNVVTVIKEDLVLDAYVVITATSAADSNAKADFPIIVKAPIVEGRVGELTTAMLQEVGNESITVTGVLTDYYIDHKASYNSDETKYDMTVKMSKGAWVGSYNYQGSKEVRSEQYREGSEIVKDEQGKAGHALNLMMINKDNEVVGKKVTNYNSIPATWENQHLWNHLGQLSINKFEYLAAEKVYKYNYDHTNVEDLYLMTYLSYCLTPLLEDTLDVLYLTVENGKVTKLLAETEKIAYPEGDEDPDSTTYTSIELTFSDIGTTVVPNPEVYSADENTAILQNALTQMAAAKNYSFLSVDTQQRAPSYDEGEYEVDASSTTKTVRAKPFGTTTSAAGTVGLTGWVVADGAAPAILFCRTSKYDATMDGKNFHSTYYGYKQIDEETYDEFEYARETKDGQIVKEFYMGVQKFSGNIMDKMPKFDFSANLFKCTEVKNTASGKVYTFVLQENNASREVAMQLGIYNAKDATSSMYENFTIKTSETSILEVKYPYELVSGTYTGYVTTTYKAIGSTEMPQNNNTDIFEGYEARVLPTWADLEMKYYHPDHSTQSNVKASANEVFAAVFGSADKVPAFEVFFNVFGDNIHGPFFDWKEKGTNPDGSTNYADYVSINTEIDEYDENGKITDEQFNAVISKLETELAKVGFEKDPANTDTTGGKTGYYDKNVCFINNKTGIQIRIQSNRTKNFFIEIYNAGDYRLNRS